MNLNNYSEGFKSEWERLSAEDKNRFESILDQYGKAREEKRVRTRTEEADLMAKKSKAITDLAQAVYEVESGKFKSAE